MPVGLQWYKAWFGFPIITWVVTGQVYIGESLFFPTALQITRETQEMATPVNFY